MYKLTALAHLTAAVRAVKAYAGELAAQFAEAAAADIAAVRSTADTAKNVAAAAQTAANAAKAAADAAKAAADSAKALMKGATASAAGAAGLAPAPVAGAQNKYLRGDGTWQTPPDTNTTYSAATQSANGLMSAADKKKLDGVAAGANVYSLPAASSSVRGGVKTGYTANGKNYPVQLSNEQMYVNVPWTDNNTTYSNMGAATASAAGKAGLVPAPAAGAQGKYLRGDGTWQTPPDTNTTYTPASAAPKANGTAAVGTSAKYAREDHVHPAQTAVSGNAGTATKLATPRAINGTNFDGASAITTAKWGTARSITIGNTAKNVDGSGNLTWSLAEIGAQAAAQGKLYGQTIDLTASAYNANTYYPVTGTGIPNDSGYHLLQCIKNLGAPKPSWATHGNGYAIQLSVLNVAGGWGAQTPYLIVLQNTSLWASGVVGWYSWLNNSSTPVFWLRGGGKYPLYTDYPCTWTVRTATYTISSQSVAPTTTAGSTIGTIYSNNLSGNAATATKLAIARKINGVAFDGSADINVKGFAAQATAPSNTSLLWIDTTAKTGGLKYHNGSAWVSVPVAYT